MKQDIILSQNDLFDLLEKGALTPKSFAIIVRLSQITLIFKINSCPKTNLFQTEEWVKLISAHYFNILAT